jgi:uncharacterized repeat protein (TIGR01451 family)
MWRLSKRYAILMARTLLFGILLGIFTITDDITSQPLPHPRIFFNDGDIPALISRATTSHFEIWDPIDRYVNAQLGNLPPAVAPINGSQDFYRDSGLILPPIALACVISQDPAYCNLGRDYLLTYAGWSQWGEQDSRSLGFAHMVMGNAIAYDWLYDQLTTAEQQTVANNLATRTQELYEASNSATYDGLWNNWWALSYMQNHYAVTHGALGLAGLALLGEDARAQTWIDHASERLQRLEYLLEGIGDGSWHESIPYQSYMMATSLPFMVNLRRLQGVDIIAHNYFNAYTYWRLYNYLPGTTQHIFTNGDFEWAWGNSRMPQHLLRFAAAEYNDPYAEWIASQIAAADGRNRNLDSAAWYVFEFFYYNPAVQPRSPVGNLPLAREFDDFEGVIWRTGWSTNDLVFGLQTGAFGGDYASSTFVAGSFPWQQPCTVTRCSLNTGHDHNDANTFSLYAGGNWLALESIGVGNYETSFHNTLLMDNQGQYRPPANNFGEVPADFDGRNGFIEASYSTANFKFVASDATRRYDIADLTDFTRYTLFASPDYFIMVDRVLAGTPHIYDWVVHFEQDMILDGNWLLGNTRNGQALGLQVIGPQPYQTTTGNDGTPYLRIRPPQPTADAFFVNLLFPTLDPAQATLLNATLVEQSAAGIGVSVDHTDGSGVTDNMILSMQSPGATTSVGNYVFDGSVALMSGVDPAFPDRIFVVGGTYLNFTGGGAARPFVQNLDPGQALEAIFSGNRVAISGVISTRVRLLAPNAQTVTINGFPASFTRDGQYIILDVPGSVANNGGQGNGLALRKIANPPFALPGDPVTWTIVIENVSGAALTDIIVEDEVPNLLEVRSVTSSQGTASFANGRVTLTQGILAPGEQVTLTITTRVRPTAGVPFSVTNVASGRLASSSDVAYAEATVISVSQLPNTGETPLFNRNILILSLTLVTTLLTFGLSIRCFRDGIKLT